MKKTTTKATKSLAAAKETKAAAEAPAAKSASKAASRKTAAATAAIVSAVARAAAPALAETPAPRAVASTAAAGATILAKVDVGFGNTVFIRGEGPGLSWDEGVAMTNVGADVWQIQLGESARPIVFKFLVNDVTWSVGPDLTIPSGATATYTPEF